MPTNLELKGTFKPTTFKGVKSSDYYTKLAASLSRSGQVSASKAGQKGLPTIYELSKNATKVSNTGEKIGFLPLMNLTLIQHMTPQEKKVFDILDEYDRKEAIQYYQSIVNDLSQRSSKKINKTYHKLDKIAQTINTPFMGSMAAIGNTGANIHQAYADLSGADYVVPHSAAEKNYVAMDAKGLPAVLADTGYIVTKVAPSVALASLGAPGKAVDIAVSGVDNYAEGSRTIYNQKSSKERKTLAFKRAAQLAAVDFLFSGGSKIASGISKKYGGEILSKLSKNKYLAKVPSNQTIKKMNPYIKKIVEEGGKQLSTANIDNEILRRTLNRKEYSKIKDNIKNNVTLRTLLSILLKQKK